MEKNKTGRYLKYAIGEIALVIIGILIALQINNWNEQRNNQVKLKSYILEYRADLINNIGFFDEQNEGMQESIDKNTKFLQIKNFDTISVDSLEVSIETFYIQFETKNHVYESFKNSQITEFGKYDSIIRGMQIYYNWIYSDINANIIEHNNAVDKADNYWRYEQNKYEFRYDSDGTTFQQTPAQRKENIVALIRDPKARNILKIDNRKKKHAATRLRVYKGFTQKIIDQINRTLNLKD